MTSGTALAIIAGGLVAGFMNTVAGGGSLITVPLLIFVGLPPGVANGTSRLAIVVQNLAATGRFAARGAVRWHAVARLAPATLAGAALGAAISAHLPDASFRRLLGLVTLVAALAVAVDFAALLRRVGLRLTGAPPEWLAQLALFATGIFGGLVQAGVGFLLLASLTLAAGLPLAAANVLKNVLVLCYAPLALAIFWSGGKVEPLPGLLLAGAQAAGAWLGAGVSLARGAAAIRVVTAVVVTASALELLGVLDLLRGG